MTENRSERIIGSYQGQEKGPLLIGIGGMHGNEPAGVIALDRMIRMLRIEPLHNADFVYKGRFVGMVGNVRAYNQKQRYIHRDLNRHFKHDILNRILEYGPELKEDLELLELSEAIKQEIRHYEPERVVILDLHTTSSHGGIFSIVTDDRESIRIALELHAPVILGMLKGIKGTSLHYFNMESLGIPTTAIVFEAGQHEDPVSVNRSIAAITNCMRTIASVNREHVENRHDKILIEYSSNLPKVSVLFDRHEIIPGSGFHMLPNFNNFQEVRKGEVLAKDINGSIRASDDGMILMPLYQKQGEDGFFLVKEKNINLYGNDYGSDDQ